MWAFQRRAVGTVPVWSSPCGPGQRGQSPYGRASASLTCSSSCRHTRQNSVGDGRGPVAFRKAGRRRRCLSDNGNILKADCGFGLDDSKSSDALLLRCSDAEVGQDRDSGIDRVHTAGLTEYDRSCPCCPLHFGRQPQTSSTQMQDDAPSVKDNACGPVRKLRRTARPVTARDSSTVSASAPPRPGRTRRRPPSRRRSAWAFDLQAES